MPSEELIRAAEEGLDEFIMNSRALGRDRLIDIGRPHLVAHEPMSGTVKVLTAPPGWGKTHGEQAELASTGASYLFASPTRDKMTESRADLINLGNDDVLAYYGLDAPDLRVKEQKMCRFWEALKLFQNAGGNAAKACGGCRFLSECPRGQAVTSSDPWRLLVTHGVMQLPLPIWKRVVYNDARIDECPLTAWQQDWQFRVNTLRRAMSAIPRLHKKLKPGQIETLDEDPKYADLYAATAGVREYLFPPIRRTLATLMLEIERLADSDQESRLSIKAIPNIIQLDNLRKQFYMAMPDTSNADLFREPDQKSLDALKARTDEVNDVRQAIRLLDVLIESLRKRDSGDELPGIYVGSRILAASIPRLRVHMGDRPKIMTATPSDPILYRHLWQDVEFESQVDFTRQLGEGDDAWKVRCFGNTHYVRVPAQVTAKRMGVDSDARPPLFEQVLAFTKARCGELRPGQRLLLICNENIWEKLHPELPDVVDHENFESVKGKNVYADGERITHPIQIALGRPEPTVISKRLTAEVYQGSTIQLEDLPIWQRRRVVEPGRKSPDVILQMPGHENPYLDALIRQTTETAVTQADRTRSYWREPGEATMYFIGQVPASQGHDEVMELDATGVALDAMEARGILPAPGKRPPFQCYGLLRGWGIDAGQRARTLFEYHDDDLNERLADYGGEGWTVANLKVPGMKHRQAVQIEAQAGAPGRAIVERLIDDGILPEGTTYHPTRKRQ